MVSEFRDIFENGAWAKITMLRQTETIESPCKLICELDIAEGLCTGCGRTREEIATWTRISRAERAFVMTQLKSRLEKLERHATDKE